MIYFDLNPAKHSKATIAKPIEQKISTLPKRLWELLCNAYYDYDQACLWLLQY